MITEALGAAASIGALVTDYVIPFVIILSVVVFVHEFGHYWVARRCGVRVEKFSIGFGHEIFGRTDQHGTRWSVAWMPLGGYVKMFGDSDPSSAKPDEETVQAMTEDEKKVAFFHQSIGKRAAIVAAGPAANYVFAILVLTGFFLWTGKPHTAPVAETIVAASAAEKAGLRAGDRVLDIDGATIESFEDIRRIVSLNTGTPIAIRIERADPPGQIDTLTATPDVVRVTDHLGGEHISGRLGLLSRTLEYRKLGALEALSAGFVEVWNISASSLRSIGQMILGTRGTEELGGPLRIAEMSGKVAKEGVKMSVWFLAVLSVSLGLINLFPIPLLDGGHLLFYAAEKLRGRPLGERAEEWALRFGFVFVIGVFVLATWNDLVHLRVVAFVTKLFS